MTRCNYDEVSEIRKHTLDETDILDTIKELQRF
jgi:hypothetical protein